MPAVGTRGVLGRPRCSLPPDIPHTGGEAPNPSHSLPRRMKGSHSQRCRGLGRSPHMARSEGSWEMAGRLLGSVQSRNTFTACTMHPLSCSTIAFPKSFLYPGPDHTEPTAHRSRAGPGRPTGTGSRSSCVGGRTGDFGAEVMS